MTGSRAAANDPKAIFEYFMEPYLPGVDKETAIAIWAAIPRPKIVTPAATTMLRRIIKLRRKGVGFIKRLDGFIQICEYLNSANKLNLPG